MELLKKIFPYSFKKMETVGELIVGIIVYAVIGLVAGAVLAIAGLLGGWIPLLGAILGVVLGMIGAIVEIYVAAGIVIKILVYTNVIKN